MAVTQKLREIGGVINSTDLNYNFNRMAEDLQLAVEGVVFDDTYAQVEKIADRNAIPEDRLTQGFWCAVSENGVVYEYDRQHDLVTASVQERYFGVDDGDLPTVPYVIDGDPSSGVLINAKYVCRADSRDADWKYVSRVSAETFQDSDWAIYVKKDNAAVGYWRRIPKWVPIMDVTSILENNIIGKLEDLHTEDKYRIVNAINEIHDDLGTIAELTTKDKSTAVAGINELDREMGDLSTLTTDHKETIVSAINEVDANVGQVEDLTTVAKTAAGGINELDKEMGDLVNLHTENKVNMVSALNEVHDDLGTLSTLTTDTKTTAVDAINELDKRVGKLPELKTADKTSIVNAINGLGDISTLETTTKATAVAAINELDARAGELVNLTTTAKNNLVSAINEVDKDVGNVSSLTTANKSDLVSAVNEVDEEMGPLNTLTTSNKETIVKAINEVDKDVGNISSLTTSTKVDAVSAINELKSITDTLRGATILIGKIELDTKDVTPEALTARALEIMGTTTVQAGWELVDKEQHEWIWNGNSWQDLEQPNIYPAQNGTLGTVRGNATGDISITDGNMTVLHAANATKLNNQTSDYYARSAHLGDVTTLTTMQKSTAVGAINELDGEHGVLSNLHTTAKSNFVSAINEVRDEVGTLSNLTTDTKTTIVAAINELDAGLDAANINIDKKADKTNVLQLDNTTAYAPTKDYHPATKQYVDAVAGGASWGKIVNNIEDQEDLMELFNNRPTKTEVLTLTNTTAYTPTADYHPATKVYVDNKYADRNKWGQMTGDIADQQDLQNELTLKQDKATAWNTTNLVASLEQPDVPASGYIIWIDLNS